MKKIGCLILLLISLTNVNGQTERGSLLVGGYLGGASYGSNESTTTYSNTTTIYKNTINSFSVNIGPTIAWFLADNMALGGNIGLGYYHSSSKTSNSVSSNSTTTDLNSTSLYLAPMFRAYFGSGKKSKPFAEIGISGALYPSNSKNKSSTGSSSETITKSKYNRSAFIKIGYEHFVNKYLGIYGSVGFEYNGNETTNDYKPSAGGGYNYTTTNKGWSTPVNMGFQIHLPKKKK